MTERPRAGAGFTLLEVVVTLAVLGISLTVLYQVFGNVARATRVSSDYYQALQIAQSRMSIALSGAQGEQASMGKSGDYYEWRTRIEPYAADGFGSSSPGITLQDDLQAYLVTVSVQWGEGDGRELELTTVRLGEGL